MAEIIVGLRYELVHFLAKRSAEKQWTRIRLARMRVHVKSEKF
jgi:hypothetical protein